MWYYTTGCLQGFAKGAKVLKASLSHKMIAIPAGFIPKHTFKEDEEERNDTKQQQQQQQQKRLTSKERSLMFGETVKTLDDVNKWTLKWDKPVDDKGASKGGDGGTNESSSATNNEEEEEKNGNQKKVSRYKNHKYYFQNYYNYIKKKKNIDRFISKVTLNY